MDLEMARELLQAGDRLRQARSELDEVNNLLTPETSVLSPALDKLGSVQWALTRAMTAFSQPPNLIDEFRRYLSEVVKHYEAEAPDVSRWADDLYMTLNEAGREALLLGDLLRALRFRQGEQWMAADYAQNFLWKWQLERKKLVPEEAAPEPDSTFAEEESA